jgi:hypothetical protein
MTKLIASLSGLLILLLKGARSQIECLSLANDFALTGRYLSVDHIFALYPGDSCI